MSIKSQDYSRFDSVSLYEEIRQDLMSQNFVINTITKELVKSIKKLESVKANPKNIKKIEKIQEITNKLYQMVYLGEEAVIITTTPTLVKEQGIYYRYLPGMTLQEWQENFFKAKLFSEKEKIYTQVKKRKRRTQVGYKDTDKSVWLYLKIEKLLPKFWREKVSAPKKDFATDELTNIPVVVGAIEYLLASEGVENVEKVKEQTEKYKDIYYKVARRYSLPTYRDLPQYLKLLDEVVS